MSADAGADIRAMKALQSKVDALQADVAALVQANLGRAALIDDGRERADRLTAEIAKLSGQVSALAGRVLILENPESPVNRAHRGLAEFQDKIDAATPGKVPAYESDKLAARRNAGEEADSA